MKLGTIHSDEVLTLAMFVTWIVGAWLIMAFLKVRHRLTRLEQQVQESSDFQLHWVAPSTTATAIRSLPERDLEAERLEEHAARLLGGSSTRTQWD